MEAGKRKRDRSYYTEEDANGFIFRRLGVEEPPVEQPRVEQPTSEHEGTDSSDHEKAAILKLLAESILSDPQLQKAEVHDKLQGVIDAVFADNDVTEILSLPNRPTLSSELNDKIEEQKKLIQQYEQELTEWEEAVEEVEQQCDQIKSQGTSQSDDSIEESTAITILGDDVSLLDDPLVNAMNVDNVKQQLETLHSTVEEGLEQMSSVQDNVIKRMEQNVEQLTTAHQLPLPTQTPRTTIVQLKQIPNINDTFYHS